MTDAKESLTKSFDMVEDFIGKTWDMYLVGLESFSSIQDQLENMIKNQLDQNKAIREGLITMVEDWSKQMRENQAQFEKMAEGIAMNAYGDINFPRMIFFPFIPVK